MNLDIEAPMKSSLTNETLNPTLVTEANPEGIAIRRTFGGIQALRGVAAVLVVLCHSTALWYGGIIDDPHHVGLANGAAGVDIFFNISGFVMALTVLRPRKPTATTFFKRRLIRIVPAYWILTALYVITIAFRFRHFYNFDGHLVLSHVIASFLFIPSRNFSGGVLPVISAGWTLYYEMFFYTLFALSLYLRASVIKFLIPVLFGLSCIGFFYTINWPPITILLSPIILEFATGILIAYLWVRLQEKITPWIWVLLGVLGFIALMTLPATTDTLRFLAWGLPASTVVLSVVMLEQRLGKIIPRWLLLIGDASYSIYLSNIILLMGFLTINTRMHFNRMPVVLFVLLCLFVIISISVAFYQLIEAPLTQALVRRFSAEAPQIIFRGACIENAS